MAAAIRTAGESNRNRLLDQIRAAVGSASVGASHRPRWWTLFAWLQQALAVVAVVGLAWLIIVAILGGFFRFDTEPLLPPTPGYEWIPLPSVLCLGGIVFGLLLGLLVRFPVGVAKKRRARQARRAVEASVAQSVDELVVAPVEAVVSRQQKIGELLRLAASR